MGGHCLAVTLHYCKDPEHSPLIQTGRKVNRSMPEYVVENVKRILSDVEDAKVSVFGLTYKVMLMIFVSHRHLTFISYYKKKFRSNCI